ncbi:MAG: hypothetical protein D6794_02795 [Deltaproteobacteria bacterium]|nr:MAG: hypothetical protein D6794_02795 [Deltaproteobacteria bacterium]
MILHPAILALLTGSLLSLLLLTLALPTVWAVLRRWNPGDCSAGQLHLERRTSLVSTLVAWAVAFHLVALALFVHTADGLHDQFVGAMCATGTLNANPVGWPLLALKLGLFFVGGLWLAANLLVRRSPDYPLTRALYASLVPLWLLVLLDCALQLSFFTGLEPQIITSCCGSLFSPAGSGVASSLTELPVRPVMALFYSHGILLLLLLLAMLRWQAAWLRYGTALLAALFLPVALVAVVSFISVYFYQLPTHHCPFDLLQAGYHRIGYLLYGTLFGGVLAAMLPGLGGVLSRIDSLRGPVAALERRWLWLAFGCLVAFLALATWPVATGSFRLLPYVK